MALEFKEKGNEYFKNNDYENASILYLKALKLSDDQGLSNNINNNYALCLIKQKSYNEALKILNEILKNNSRDVKALYRRCLTFKYLEKYAEAFNDAKQLLKLNEKSIYPLYNELKLKLQEQLPQLSSTDTLLKILPNIKESSNVNKYKDLEKILALSHETFGPDLIIKHDGVEILQPFLRDDKYLNIVLDIFLGLCGDSKKATLLINIISPIYLIELMKNSNAETNSLIYKLLVKLFSNLIDKTTQPSKEVSDMINDCFNQVFKNLKDITVTESCKNSCLNLIIKLAGRENGFGWSSNLVMHLNAIPVMLDLACSIKLSLNHDSDKLTHSNSSSHATTTTTQYLISLALNVLWEDMCTDKLREEYRKIASNYMKKLIAQKSPETNINVIKAISVLLQGPTFIGDSIVGLCNLSGMMVKMAESGNKEEKIAALDALVLTASNSKRCQGIMANGVPVFKTLYKSDHSDDDVKIRALMGICKVGSLAGSDTTLVPFKEASNLKLALACKKYLVESECKNSDLNLQAAEALSYLSFNADIKEFIINDDSILDSLFDISITKVGDDNSNLIFVLANLFMNLTNSYDKPNIEPELIELAKQAKQHIPQESPKDSESYVKLRIDKLIDRGIINCLVPLASTKSNANREAVSRIFLACSTDEKNRGKIIQRGGAKALLGLALTNTEQGKVIAAHALAKIYITNNPELSFPGDKYLDLVRPLLKLLHVERTSLENFEALMALTNVASISQTAKKRILYEHGMSDIVNYLYEDVPLLRRASAECLCNLTLCPEFTLQFCEASDDRVKMVALLIIDSEDVKLHLAAAGALCSLVENDKAVHKILEIKSLFDILRVLLLNENVDLRFRGMYVLRALIFASKDFAEKFIADDLYFALVNLTPKEQQSQNSVINPVVKNTNEFALETIEKCKEYGLVRDINNPNPT